MKTISDQELKDYLEALYNLLDFALTKCEAKWTDDLQNELLFRFEAMKQKSLLKIFMNMLFRLLTCYNCFLMFQEILRCYDFLKKQSLLQM